MLAVRRSRARLVLAVAALAIAAPATATHPLATDDAGTLGAGRRQLELGAGLERDRASHAGVEVREDVRGVGAVLTLGLGAELDLALLAAASASRVREDGGRVGEAAGPGDVAVELKWRILGDEALALAVKPGLTLPTGDPRRGLGTGRPGLSLALAATRTAGALSLDVNGRYERRGLARPEDRAALRADRLSASAAVRARAHRSLQLVAEVGAATGDERSERVPSVFALAGAVVAVAGDVDVDLGARVGLTAPEVDLAWLGGATWRF